MQSYRSPGVLTVLGESESRRWFETSRITDTTTKIRISEGLHSVVKVKVNCTLVEALRLSTGRTAHRGSSGTALLFLDHSTRTG